MTHVVSLKPQLAEPYMEVMNFLNEAAMRYPNAISFAAGQPPQDFVSTRECSRWIASFVSSCATQTGAPEDALWKTLGQYGNTNGAIGEHVARLLRNDEGLQVDPAKVMITNGMQEAVLILLLGIFSGAGNDVLLCDDPAYVGLVGAANLARVPVMALSGRGSIVERAEAKLARLKAEHVTARALYVVPDFSNPLGHTLSLHERQALLDLASRHELLIVEDIAYRAFRYDGQDIPTLKALDHEGLVVQIGSFSKLFMPGPRVGYLYADQEVRTTRGQRQSLSEALSKVKSFVSVLTSPLTQALVAGFLIEQDFSLRAWNTARVARCRANRDLMLGCLEAALPQRTNCRWTRPEGGFFLVLETRADFGHEALLTCAERFGVLVCPVGFFTSDRSYSRHIRLAFSNVSPEHIRSGVERLAAYLLESGGCA